jgi:Flp pilus assembly protein CpaB
MKPKSLLLLFIAGTCGLIAAVFTAQHLAGNEPIVPAAPSEDRKSVVVAVSDIPAGTYLKEDMLKIVEMPSKDLPEDTHAAMTPLIGHRLRFQVVKNEPVLANKLGRGTSTVAGDLGPGMKACAVPVSSEDRIMTGLINPGDQVDVYWLQPQQDLSDTSVRLLLQNVKVMAVGLRTDTEESEGTTSRDSKSNLTDAYTLEVTPLHNRRVQAALLKGGKIRLSLRGKGDTTLEDLDDKALDMQLGLIAPLAKQVELALASETEPEQYEVEYIRGNETVIERFNIIEPRRLKSKTAKPN